MRAAGTPPVHIAGRGQDGGLQLHRGVVQSCPSPFRHPLSIPNRLRDADAQGNPNHLSDKPSTKPGQLQSRARVTQALDRVRKAARQRKKEQFTSLLHHMNVDLLRTAFYALKRKAAPGVDGMMWADYEADLEPRLEDLHGRVHRGAYRPRPCRR